MVVERKTESPLKGTQAAGGAVRFCPLGARRAHQQQHAKRTGEVWKLYILGACTVQDMEAEL